MNKILFLIALSPILAFQSCISESAKLHNSEPDNSPGERTAQITAVFDNIDGKSIFTINKNITMETAPTDNPLWTEIAVMININKDEFLRNELKAGKILKDKEGRDLGQILETQKIWECNKDRDNTFGILKGFIRTSDIDRNSILENIIGDTCNKKKHCTISDLENIISRYDFVNYQFDSLMTQLDFYKDEYSKLNGIVEFMLEDSWLSDPGSDRLSLLFLHDTLISIIHKRPLDIKESDIYHLQDNRTLIFLDTNKKDIAEQLVKFKTEFYGNLFSN